MSNINTSRDTRFELIILGTGLLVVTLGLISTGWLYWSRRITIQDARIGILGVSACANVLLVSSYVLLLKHDLDEKHRQREGPYQESMINSIIRESQDTISSNTRIFLTGDKLSHLKKETKVEEAMTLVGEFLVKNHYYEDMYVYDTKFYGDHRLFSEFEKQYPETVEEMEIYDEIMHNLVQCEKDIIKASYGDVEKYVNSKADENYSTKQIWKICALTLRYHTRTPLELNGDNFVKNNHDDLSSLILDNTNRVDEYMTRKSKFLQISEELEVYLKEKEGAIRGKYNIPLSNIE